MFKPIDYLLDRITMYRLVLYYLIALVVIAAGLSVAGKLQFSALGILFSACYTTVICVVSNEIFAWIFEVPANIESAYITALILALIITPFAHPHDILFLTAASGLAIASKYILAVRKKHIFNPAAVAVALTAAGAGQSASWWIGSSVMLPYVLIGGILVVRKIERGKMLLSFFAAITISTTALSLLSHRAIVATLEKTAFHSSLLFLAFVMLTEPLTSPATAEHRTWYAALVGVLFPPQIHIANIYSTPELALLAGNIYAYLVSPKIKIMPRLTQKVTTGPGTMDFIFALDKPIAYKPGQYMEWTLPLDKTDSRGNRRYFTLASSPTENNLRLGVKFYKNGSAYKSTMLAMDNTTPIVAGQLGGDFTLPDDVTQKLVFIAGGIGITPFRSMAKYLIDTQQKRDVILLYSENTADTFAYTDVFNQASTTIGLRPVYTISNLAGVPAGWQGRTGLINGETITQEVPDYLERLFYVSGPHTMVANVRDSLRKLGVPRHQIKTDFFPGYA